MVLYNMHLDVFLYSSRVQLIMILYPPLSPAGLIISLQLLRGDMEQVRRENPLIFNRGVAITRKLGFPDVIMPGESHTYVSGADIKFCQFNLSNLKNQWK